MSNQFIILKARKNKRNKQYNVSIPKKQFKKLDSTLKFGEELFVKLKIIKKLKGGKKINGKIINSKKYEDKFY